MANEKCQMRNGKCSGRYHHPKRAARLGIPVRSRFCNSNPGGGPKRLGFVCFFPSEAVTRTAEMSVRCRRFIDRTAKVESFDDLSRRQRKVFAHQIGKLSFANPAAASGVDSNRDRFSDADRVSKLD